MIFLRICGSRCAATFGCRDSWKSDDGFLTSAFLAETGLDEALDVFDRVATIWNSFEGANDSAAIQAYACQDKVPIEHVQFRTTVSEAGGEATTQVVIRASPPTHKSEVESATPTNSNLDINIKVLEGTIQDQNVRSVYSRPYNTE
jgi:hypothetical protein